MRCPAPTTVGRRPSAASWPGAHRLLVFMLAAFSVAWAATARALPGDLDPYFARFGTFGHVLLDHNLTAHAVQPDGKIVLAGYAGIAVRVVRLNPDGTFDTSFDQDGAATLSNLQYAAVARSVAIQPDGRIVVAGYADTSPADIMVLRLTPNGSPDLSFGSGGFVRFGISNDTDIAEKVLIEPSGKIVLAGYSYVGGDWDFAAARLNPDGSLDPTFSGDGKLTIGLGGDDRCFDAVLQDDGRIVLVGNTFGGIITLDSDFGIVRLNADGTLDNTFDGDGKLTTGFGDLDYARAVVIQPDGKLLVAGDNHVGRYDLVNGALDGSLDSDGKLTVAGVDEITDLAVAGDGKILMIGRSGGNAVLYALNPDGSFDNTFNLTGSSGLGPSDPLGGANGLSQWPSLTRYPDGRLLAVVPNGSDCDVYRRWPNSYVQSPGLQTAAFDDPGFPPGSQETGYALARQSDGRLVVAGSVSNLGYTESDFALARFTTDGQLDGTFGTRGRVSLDFSNDDVGRAVLVQSDGKIVVGGYEGTGNGVNFLVARFNSDGSLDDTFGFFGYNVVDFFGGQDYGVAIALTSDDRILVAGPVFNGSHFVFGVARFTSDGILDDTFDGDGKQTFDFPGVSSQWVSSMVVEGNGRIVLGGFVDADFALVGFTPAGALDTGFGTSGHTRTDVGGNDYLNALAVGPTGYLYAGGSHETGGHTVFVVARYTSLGVPAACTTRGCTSWPYGRAVYDWGAGTDGAVYSIDVRGDGQILAAGSLGDLMGWIQLTPAGAVTLSRFINFPGNDETASGACFDGANHFVIAGYQKYDGDHNFALARFETTVNASLGVDDPVAGPVAAVRLGPAFPNPLVGRASLAFELPRDGTVRLVVFDASGRRVRTLADGAFLAGRHRVAWDGADDRGTRVAPGVYYARLEAGTASARRAIVVLR